ncbi:D-altronate dehydratase [Natranaerovirga hydrolytica]|uniref:D-altronate dehydratase n=1 Tax=Natranaerovirga hydrolytica TaxID=680378 RepID=A0A4V2PZ10_9FIRM|nr:altronate dehydratase family protein [Natranaerovirga hydrolytica]TCK87981.1 D-altronate dehydratase [Natranaerovirga hydrolytica]
MNKTQKITDKDNVVVALKEIKKGETVNNTQVLEDVQAGYKIAIKDIEKEQNIIKYGSPIGSAKEKIRKGSIVHVHNTKTNLDDIIDYQYEGLIVDEISTTIPDKDVNIYRRKNGQIGIRNELWIVPTVACVNRVGQKMIDVLKEEIDTSKIDGVNIYIHPYGCSQMGDDHKNTKEALQNITKHPNAGGVLVLGLGCENNQVSIFKETLGEYDKDRVKFLVAQDVKDEIKEGVKRLKELYEKMKNDKRVPGKFSEINVGLKCGGSDAFSGITANPLLGRFSDYLTYHGGTTVLTEVPEMFGAEHLLMKRAESKEVFNKIVKMINDFKKYYKSHNQPIYENPSPGNIKGGITTLEDKSLGTIQKGGHSKVVDVIDYTGKIKKNGLNLLAAPGNDLVSTTALGMCGCQLALFTTGRGTPYGVFVPTIKVSTNTKLSDKKPTWIDFDAGRLIDGVTMDDLLEDFIDKIVQIVNGKLSNNEINDAKEIALFKTGVTL